MVDRRRGAHDLTHWIFFPGTSLENLSGRNRARADNVGNDGRLRAAADRNPNVKFTRSAPSGRAPPSPTDVTASSCTNPHARGLLPPNGKSRSSHRPQLSFQSIGSRFGFSAEHIINMAIGGGVCVPSASSSSAPAVEPRRRGVGTVRRGKGIRCSCVGGAGAAGGLAKDHYRTLRLRPGATRREVKKAFRQLALMYHPDVCKESDRGVDFQRISVAYQVVMSNMREAEERLEYWRLKYGLTDEDLDKYRCYLNDDDDEWFDL